MARDVNGVYSLPSGNPVVAGTLITASWANTTLADVAAELTNSIDKGGRTTPTADLPMGSFKLTGLAAGTAAGHSVRYEQVQRNGYTTLASAATCELGSKSEGTLSITGTTTITSFGSTAETGQIKELIFVGALQITYHATSMILPGAASITTVAGDRATFVHLGAGNWNCINYVRATGAALVAGYLFGNGTVSAPGLSFTNEPDCGLYVIGTNNIGFAINGSKVLDIAAGSLTVVGPVNASTSGYRLDSNAHSMYYNGTALVLRESTADVAKFNGSGMALTGNGHGIIVGNSTSGSANTVQINTSISGGIEVQNYRASSGSAPMFSGSYLNMAGSSSYNAFQMSNSGGLFFRVDTAGGVFADGAYSGAGADFAEWFIPVEGVEFRPGDPVVISGGRVALASPFDDPIGVISENPTVVGDSKLRDKGGVLVGILGKLRVRKGATVSANWILMDGSDPNFNLYLVR